jgi:Flp pilus assembly protein TadG
MRTSSKFFSFAIAAIVLLAAANASFAQAQANESRAEVSQSAGEHGAELALAVNSKSAMIERAVTKSAAVSNVAEMKSISKPTMLSRSAFNVTTSSNQVVKFDANQFMGDQLKASMAPANNEFQSTDNSSRKVEFVPSRGQILPDKN